MYLTKLLDFVFFCLYNKYYADAMSAYLTFRNIHQQAPLLGLRGESIGICFTAPGKQGGPAKSQRIIVFWALVKTGVDMTEYERKQQFYEQFNTVVANWAEWRQTPQATLEILRDPWKAQAPEVVVRSPDDDRERTRHILNQIRMRHTAAGTYTPPGDTP